MRLTAEKLTAYPLTARRLTAVRVGEAIAGFNPVSLNPNAFFEFSRMSTLFQDAAGTTPVTAVGQPVGLALDQSQGATSLADAGPSLNEGISESASLGTWTVVGDVASNDGTNNFSPIALSFDSPLEAGAFYVVSVEVTRADSGSARVQMQTGGVFTTAIDFFSSVGIYSSVYQAASAHTSVRVQTGSNGFDGSVTKFQVRKLPGNHATQSTATARPIWNGSGLTFDGVDDFLVTPSIDLTGTDAATLAAAMHSDLDVAGNDFVVDFNNAAVLADGGLRFYIESVASHRLTAESRGSATAFVALVNDDYRQAAAAILRRDISSPIVALQSNLQSNSNSLTQGTGNNGILPLHIGSRGDESENFKGRILSVVLLGRYSTTDETGDLQSWLNSKAGV